MALNLEKTLFKQRIFPNGGISVSSAPSTDGFSALKKGKAGISDVFLRHPYAVLMIACLYVCALFDVTDTAVLSPSSVIFVFGSVAVSLLIYLCLKNGKDSGKGVYATVYFTFISLAVFVGSALSENTVFYLCVFSIVICVAVGVYLAAAKKLSSERLIILIVILGFTLRVAYIQYTTLTPPQHDVWYFASDKYHIGHAGYIEYFYDNLRLPDFDPRTVWQFYHPPLHHITAALWMRINTALGMPYMRAVENIQILTLFYSSTVMITTVKLVRELGFKGFSSVIPCLYIAVHPTFILLSGSVNNDILSIALAFGGMLALVRWYKKPVLSRIVVIALCIGAGMMAKSSAVLICPGVAAVFLIKFIKNLREWKKYLLQFAVFGIICIPLGLWWQVRNCLLFGMPITYVPMLAQNSDQYIGFHTVLERTLKITPEQFEPIYMAWNPERNGASYYEYNCFVGLLKSSVFGEFSPYYLNAQQLASASDAQLSVYKIGDISGYFLFYSHLALVIGIFAGLLKTFFSKKSPLDGAMKIFVAILFAATFVSYVKFCFEYPHTCTMNMRYATPLIAVGAISLGCVFYPESGRIQRLLGIEKTSGENGLLPAEPVDDMGGFIPVKASDEYKEASGIQALADSSLSDETAVLKDAADTFAHPLKGGAFNVVIKWYTGVSAAVFALSSIVFYSLLAIQF